MPQLNSFGEFLDAYLHKLQTIGFTGTRKGMSSLQEDTLCKLLSHLDGFIAVAHHGDCLGADSEFHELCRETGFNIHVHPPLQQKYRAFCESAEFEHPPKDYLVRNRNIVDACDILIATPFTPERRRSGTWSTVRYARKQQKPIVVVSTDGTADFSWKK